MPDKTKLEKNLDDLFDLPIDSQSIVSTKADSLKTNTPAVVSKDNQSRDIETDYKYARENLYEIIENGSHAIHERAEIAKSSEHPRAFEVVASLMKTLTDANKDLLDIQSKVKKLKTDDIQQGPNNVTNALFVGSTAELQNMLKDNLKDTS